MDSPELQKKIINWDQIEFNRLLITKKPQKLIEKNQTQIDLHEIYYCQKKKLLIIQTPKLYLPFGLSQITSNTDHFQVNLSFQDLKTNQTTDNFFQQIKDLDSFFSQIYPGYNFFNSIRIPDDKFYPPYLKTKITRSSSNSYFKVYDDHNQEQSKDYLIPGSWATSLIYLKHLWINQKEKIVGLSWYILQTKVRSPIPVFKECQINDNWDNETLCANCSAKIPKSLLPPNNQPATLELPVEYQKYTKMLKLGIPILAVLQRCELDGLDPEVLKSNSKINSQVSQTLTELPKLSKPPPPPPPPVNHPPINLSPGRPRILFNASDLLKSKSKLGKDNIKAVKKTMKICLKKRDPRVPSLNMILRSLNNLKKTEFPKAITNEKNSTRPPPYLKLKSL